MKYISIINRFWDDGPDEVVDCFFDFHSVGHDPADQQVIKSPIIKIFFKKVLFLFLFEFLGAKYLDQFGKWKCSSDLYAVALKGSPGCGHHHVQVCVMLDLREVFSRDGENQPEVRGVGEIRKGSREQHDCCPD